MNRFPKLYFDCTATTRSGLNTGVQRVVRELLEKSSIFENELGIEFQAICYQYNGFYSLEDALDMTLDTEHMFETVDFKYRDIYLCADSFWAAGISEWFEYLKQNGVTIICVIYDLIPIYFSDFFEMDTVNSFSSSIDEVIKYSDLLACISKASKKDLNKYLELNYEGENKNVRREVFHLSPGELNKESSSILKTDVGTYSVNESNYFLMVGTIERRKGYGKVLKEFKKVWSENPNTALYIVGKVGENATEIINKINKLIEKGYPIKCFENISDVELYSLYDNASAVICASSAEGFGLPLVEALSQGCLVFANRIPVFGEVAGSYPIYFDINNTGDLAEKISQYDNYSPLMVDVTDFPTWDETAVELTALIRSISPLYKYSNYSHALKLNPASIAWAYRVILGQNIDSEETIQYWLKECSTLDALIEKLNYKVRNDDQSFRLGDKLAYLNNNNYIVNEDIKKLPPFILTVGTIEYRKNHITLINAYRLLVSEGNMDLPALVIVGRPGWLDNSLAYQIENDPSIHNLVHVYSDVSDDDLDYLYRNCLFTVYPSIYEGWGLPVAESLRYGKQCITSNSSSMLEIAPELTRFAHPLKVEEWARSIYELTNDPDMLARENSKVSESYLGTTWEQCANEILVSLKAIGSV